jgi:hypothetical protein
MYVCVFVCQTDPLQGNFGPHISTASSPTPTSSSRYFLTRASKNKILLTLADKEMDNIKTFSTHSHRPFK